MYTKQCKNFFKNSNTSIKELIFKEQILQILAREIVCIYRKHQAKLENYLKEVQQLFSEQWKRQGNKYRRLC